MSNTPLSDLMTRVIEGTAKDALVEFYAAFIEAKVGVTVVDAPDVPPGTVVDGSGMHMPNFRAANGMLVMRACADPEIFVERYDPSVNARMPGRAVLEMLMKLDPELAGVLVASAASEHSILIPRENIPGLLSGRARARKPWWKLW